MMFGDLLHEALATVGVTEERVSRWLGRDCGCDGRRQALNDLDAWARRVVAGKVEYAREYLERILGESETEQPNHRGERMQSKVTSRFRRCV